MFTNRRYPVTEAFTDILSEFLLKGEGESKNILNI